MLAWFLLTHLSCLFRLSFLLLCSCSGVPSRFLTIATQMRGGGGAFPWCWDAGRHCITPHESPSRTLPPRHCQGQPWSPSTTQVLFCSETWLVPRGCRNWGSRNTLSHIILEARSLKSGPCSSKGAREESLLPLPVSGGSWRLLVSLAFSSITPVSASIFSWPLLYVHMCPHSVSYKDLSRDLGPIG